MCVIILAKSIFASFTMHFLYNCENAVEIIVHGRLVCTIHSSSPQPHV